MFSDRGFALQKKYALLGAFVPWWFSVLRVPHDEHRDDGRSEDFLGHAADHPPRRAGPPRGRHGEEVRAFVAGTVQDFHGGISASFPDVRRNARGFEILLDEAQSGGSLLLRPGVLAGFHHVQERDLRSEMDRQFMDVPQDAEMSLAPSIFSGLSRSTGSTVKLTDAILARRHAAINIGAPTISAHASVMNWHAPCNRSGGTVDRGMVPRSG